MACDQGGLVLGTLQWYCTLLLASSASWFLPLTGLDSRDYTGCVYSALECNPSFSGKRHVTACLVCVSGGVVGLLPDMMSVWPLEPQCVECSAADTHVHRPAPTFCVHPCTDTTDGRVAHLSRHTHRVSLPTIRH